MSRGNEVYSLAESIHMKSLLKFPVQMLIHLLQALRGLISMVLNLLYIIR